MANSSIEAGKTYRHLRNGTTGAPERRAAIVAVSATPSAGDAILLADVTACAAGQAHHKHEECHTEPLTYPDGNEVGL